MTAGDHHGDFDDFDDFGFWMPKFEFSKELSRSISISP
jgi:hypothetical protein